MMVSYKCIMNFDCIPCYLSPSVRLGWFHALTMCIVLQWTRLCRYPCVILGFLKTYSQVWLGHRIILLSSLRSPYPHFHSCWASSPPHRQCSKAIPPSHPWQRFCRLLLSSCLTGMRGNLIRVLVNKSISVHSLIMPLKMIHLTKLPEVKHFFQLRRWTEKPVCSFTADGDRWAWGMVLVF